MRYACCVFQALDFIIPFYTDPWIRSHTQTIFISILFFMIRQTVFLLLWLSFNVHANAFPFFSVVNTNHMRDVFFKVHGMCMGDWCLFKWRERPTKLTTKENQLHKNSSIEFSMWLNIFSSIRIEWHFWFFVVSNIAPPPRTLPLRSFYSKYMWLWKKRWVQTVEMSLQKDQ